MEGSTVLIVLVFPNSRFHFVSHVCQVQIIDRFFTIVNDIPVCFLIFKILVILIHSYISWTIVIIGIIS